MSTEAKTSDKKAGTPQARVGSEAGRKADEAKAVRTRRRKVPSRRTQIALRAADPTPTKRGRPPKFSHELVVSIIDEVANGKSIIDRLRELSISGVSFYRWLDQHPDLSNLYEDAKRARERLSEERMWRLAQNEDDDGANGRRTAAMLIEKALSFQANRFMAPARPRHEVEHGEPPPEQMLPTIEVHFGRDDKPPGWKVTDDFPELGHAGEETNEKTKPNVLDLEAIEKQKAGFIGEE